MVEPSVPSAGSLADTAPVRLRRQPSWLEGLLPTPERVQSIRLRSNYLANFNWGSSFWHLLNASETMNVLAVTGPGGARGLAQLWIIGKIDFAALTNNKWPGRMLKLCLSNDDRTTLWMMLKKWGNLVKDWDPASIENVVNIYSISWVIPFFHFWQARAFTWHISLFTPPPQHTPFASSSTDIGAK